MARNFICPLTEAACEDGRCTGTNCIGRLLEQEQQRKTDAATAERHERAQWAKINRSIQDWMGEELGSVVN